jgi:hypothetical protein
MQKSYIALAALCLTTSPVSAATVFDAPNDFLGSYAGPTNGDLDVTSFSVDYNSGSDTFLLGAAFAGAINAALPGFYIIGVNTGTGTIAPFAGIGQPNVTFNQAIRVNKDGTGAIGATPLAAGAVTIVGNLFTASVPASLLISTGAVPQNYGFNIWPRIGLGQNDQISDFAPDNALLRVGVPEIGTWSMMVLGIGAIGVVIRRRRATKKVRQPRKTGLLGHYNQRGW